MPEPWLRSRRLSKALPPRVGELPERPSVVMERRRVRDCCACAAMAEAMGVLGLGLPLLGGEELVSKERGGRMSAMEERRRRVEGGGSFSLSVVLLAVGFPGLEVAMFAGWGVIPCGFGVCLAQGSRCAGYEATCTEAKSCSWLAGSDVEVRVRPGSRPSGRFSGFGWGPSGCGWSTHVSPVRRVARW